MAHGRRLWERGGLALLSLPGGLIMGSKWVGVPLRELSVLWEGVEGRRCVDSPGGPAQAPPYPDTPPCCPCGARQVGRWTRLVLCPRTDLREPCP